MHKVVQTENTPIHMNRQRTLAVEATRPLYSVTGREGRVSHEGEGTGEGPSVCAQTQRCALASVSVHLDVVPVRRAASLYIRRKGYT